MIVECIGFVFIIILYPFMYKYGWKVKDKKKK